MLSEQEQAVLSKFTLQDVDMALAHNSLWHFCQTMLPNFYLDGREYLRDMCEKVEDFVENSDKHFLVINAPPRHGKSITAQSLTAWLLGRDPAYRIMTASYNEDVAATFARSVRNTIQTEKLGKNIVYSDIFPKTKVKYGEAAAQRWTLEGQTLPSYLATSPRGTATGFGCDFLICDDLIKNAEDAYNENELNKTWEWFVNTMLSRLEGKRKVVIIMTRWAEKDLAGRVLEAFSGDLELITYKVQSDDGKMLCEDILDAKSYAMLKQEMNLDILEANYNQKPIDVQGRLFTEFKTWEKMPENVVIRNYTDTADTGSDFLCSINYFVFNDEAYITDLVFTDEPMEVTEDKVAALLFSGNVNEAVIESNNGGRGFARNIERILKEKYSTNKVHITSTTQTKNKESRILASSAWLQNHAYMPLNWRTRFPEFYRQTMSYQRKGKNAHDDAVDVLAAIYEYAAIKPQAKFYTEADLGFGSRSGARPAFIR